MSTITAIVHTKNSAKTLEKCLASLAWCDEVFVVDMESTDETVAIARSFKATTYSVQNTHRIADPIRNEFMKKVKTEWTLIIDSDEEVSPTLAAKIKEVMITQGINGMKLPRKNMIFGKWIEHTGFWPDYIIRLFRTGTCTYPSQVHGQPVVDGRVEELPAKEAFALIHHHYDSVEQYLLRLNVYTSLEVEKYHEKSTEVIHQSEFLTAFFSEFHRRFFAQKGYKDGMHGLVLSLLQSVYQLVVVVKRWELQKKEQKVNIEEIEIDVGEACSATSYWVANEKVDHSTHLIKKQYHKIKRKLHSIR